MSGSELLCDWSCDHKQPIYSLFNTDQIGLVFYFKSGDLLILNITICINVYFSLFLDGVDAFNTYHKYNIISANWNIVLNLII